MSQDRQGPKPDDQDLEPRPLVPAEPGDDVLACVERVALDVLDILEPLHAGGAVHGHLCWNSLRVRDDGRVLVIDTDVDVPWITAPETAFASPERVRGTACDARSDLYSLACVLYAVGEGAPPWGWDTSGHGPHGPPPPPEPLRLPPAVYTVLLRAFDRRPAYRYQRAETMRQALLEAFEAESWQPTLDRPLESAVADEPRLPPATAEAALTAPQAPQRRGSPMSEAVTAPRPPARVARPAAGRSLLAGALAVSMAIGVALGALVAVAITAWLIF